MRYFHIDGFRVDAVANMLYWNKEGQEQSNEHAVSFLRELNEAVFAEDEDFLMTAEDSTAWPLVTTPTYEGGLGFNHKWNMGWMNDVLKYMECAPEYRKHIHEKMTFLCYMRTLKTSYYRFLMMKSFMEKVVIK